MKKLITAAAFIIFLKLSIKAQVAINPANTPPNFSAMLDINSTSKGLLIPRIALTGAYDIVTVPSPVASLLIYNTANTGSGISAIVPGFYYFTGAKWVPISSANGWSLTGNAGTSAINNFIGTTDNQPLKFRVNNLPVGELNPSTGNISIGLKSMSADPESHSNIAIGTGSLYQNDVYSNLIAIGDSALYNVGAVTVDGLNPTGNIAIGSKALYANYTGANNTATGFQALRSNESGNNNTATGYAASVLNTDGDENTATGFYALASNTTGSNNAAVGSESLSSNVNGINNSSVGSHALYSNKFGSHNTALGYKAAQAATGNWNTAVGGYSLLNTTAGQANVAIGFQALQFNTTGDNNTAIGTNAGPVSGAGIYSNSTAIGQSAVYTASNQVRVGSTAVTAIGGYANFVNISDIRFKKNVQPETHGLDFILKLQPIVYNMDVHKLNRFIYGDVAADTLFKGTLQKAITDKENILYSGFSAQQVEEASNAIGYNFSGVQKPQNDHDHYALAYSEFVVPLVKAVQEQQTQIENQNNLINALQKRLDALESKKN